MKKILFILILCFSCLSFNHIKPVLCSVEYKDTSFLNKELNDSILYLALQHYEVTHPKIVLAQAKLESGNYKSGLCKNGNNFLGLYNSSQGRYYTFNHWTECILAYKNKVEYKKKEGECHYVFLKRISYAEDPNYEKLVRSIEKSLNI